jgi:spore coat polysaccharide biosynthesis protein SpsF
MGFTTEQEAFWAGPFGVDYIARNQGERLLASNIDFFARSLRGARVLGSCIEFGANIGMNLRALKLLHPQQEQHAIEINATAAGELAACVPRERIFQGSILDYQPARTFDLVLIKGVLIHIHPDELPKVYHRLYRCTGKYLLIAEYYNPTPVAIAYRGHADRLFKRDFCGEMLDLHPDLSLLDYGFCYRRDPTFPQDDITWFLLEKRG